MATNPPRKPMTTAEVRKQRKQVTRLMRHPEEHPSRRQHPSAALVHYALDLEEPPVIACDAEPELSSTNPDEVTCPDCMAHDQFPTSRVSVHPPRETTTDITEPPTITANDVLMVAADLLVDANYDYSKAIVDMTSQLIGAGPDDTILMTRILRSLAQGD